VTSDAITVVIVTHENSAQITDTLGALMPQLGDDDELIVVDNRSRDGTVAAVRAAAPPAKIVEQDRNLGFAGGARIGAEAGSAPLLLFLNPDARPAPDCLRELRSVAVDRPGWGAWQALITMDGGGTINSAGNVTHFLGIAWAGRCGQPVSEAPLEPREVSCASGAALVVRRETWDRVGAFDERYFMYCEDVDLSLRLWLSGWAVGIASGARVEHDYEFQRGRLKWFLLERNRWWTVLSDYPAGLLVLLFPALLAAEVGLLAVAARDGWGREKLRAQAAVLRELPQIWMRRRRVQAVRGVAVADFARHLSSSLESPYLSGLARFGPLVAIQSAYWNTVRRLLRS
jgi:N-acetylglucosaminyl-diphospho-decaprenol L-rhamnosyltransferase